MSQSERQAALEHVKNLNKALRRAGAQAVLPVMKAPTKNHALAQAIGDVFGTKVLFVTKNRVFQGVAHDGVAYITEDMHHPELAVAGHEVFHVLEETSPAAAESLREHIRAYLKKDVVKNRQKWEQQRGSEEVSERDAEGEVIADLNGAMWLDPKFWREMVQRDANLFRRVAYLFMESATKVVKGLAGTRFDAEALVTDVDAVRKLIAQTWADRNQERAGSKPSDRAPAFSRNDIATITVDGVDRPWHNSKGQPIAFDRGDLENFWRWFGDSKVVDGRGRPLVVYHGTNADFSTFDETKIGQTDSGWYGKGFYFTPNSNWTFAEDAADNRGGHPNVMPVYLSIQDPVYAYAHAERGSDMVGGAKRRGKDGVIVHFDPGHEKAGEIAEVVAVAPEQIKSATGNRGTFDGNNPNIRFSRNDDTAARNALKSLSEMDSLFKLPKSDEKEIEDIAYDNDPDIKIERVKNFPGETRYKLTTPNGKTATISIREFNPYGQSLYGHTLEDGEMRDIVDDRPGRNAQYVEGKDDVWINVSSLDEGGGFGAKVYNIAATYAHNNGKVFIGDPDGVSDQAMRRRPEQMLSSALKFGTTKHLAPHPWQIGGDPSIGVGPLDWVYGDHIGNIEKLIDLNLANLESAGGTGGIAYNVTNGTFTDSDGNELSRDDIDAIARAGLGRQAHAGGTTLARAALLRALRDAGQADVSADAGAGSARRVADDGADAQAGSGRQTAPADAGMPAGARRAGGDAVSQSPVGQATGAGRDGMGILEQLVQLAGQFPETTRNLFYSRNDDVDPAGGWMVEPPSKWDDFRHAIQDKQVDTKRVVQAIRKTVGEVNDTWNPYLQEELFHGRSAKQVNDFLSDELKPLLQDMQMRGVTMQDLEKYLHMRHAEERNIQIAKVNPDMPDGGAGVDTAEAREYLAGLPESKKRAYEALAKRVDAINRNTRQILIDSGLETAETVKAWEAAYQYYVPLQREESGAGGIGQGFSVRGSASKRAMGSKRAVVDILANIAMQRERTIVRAEKNRVATALYGLAITAPNKDFWLPINPEKLTAERQAELVRLGLNPLDVQNIADEPKQRYVDQRTGLVAERVNPFLRSAPNVLSARVNGEDRYVFFSEEDERAVRMVRSLKNLDADQLGRLLSMSAKVTRYFASINTQYNPIFGIINLMRDVQGSLLNLSTTPIAGKQKEVLANTISALRGIYIDVRDTRAGLDTNSSWATLYEEFQREGGQTGFRDMFSNSKERAEAIQRELDPDAWMDSPLGKIFSANGTLKVPLSYATRKAGGVFDWLSDYNTAMENAVRLASYKVAKDQGLTNQQAASLAKNISVNFNRKGQVATQAGALYAFFNASVQGTARLTETLRGPAGKKIVLGGLILGSMQALLFAMAGYDDDEPPEFVKSRNLVLPLDWVNNIGGPDLDGKYLSIPMPLGFNILPGISRITTEFVLGGFKNPGKKLMHVVDMLADNFNPIGNAGLSLQTISPTAIDPLAALSENRDWTGKPIAKKDMSQSAPTPGHTRAKDTASEISKTLSFWLNAASGGTKYKPGLVSPTPDQLDYLIGQAFGGVGREALKLEQTVTSTVTGEDLPPHKVPLLGRFYGDTKGQSSVASKFYDNIKALNEHEAEIKGRRKDKGDVTGYLRQHPEAMLTGLANQVERDVSDLRRRKRELLEKSGSKERVKLVEQQIAARMKFLNDRVERAERRQ